MTELDAVANRLNSGCKPEVSTRVVYHPGIVIFHGLYTAYDFSIKISIRVASSTEVWAQTLVFVVSLVSYFTIRQDSISCIVEEQVARWCSG